MVDEIGYLPVSQDGAILFFQLVNARHERASTVLTSNKGFEDWGGVLGDEVMAAARSAAAYRRAARRGWLNMTAIPASFLKVCNFQE